MENIKPTESTVQTEETIVDPQGNIIRRVKNFTDYAFRKAGLNNGDSYSLLTHLNWIKDGHLIDEGFNAQEHLLRKKKIEGQLDEKVDEKTRM